MSVTRLEKVIFSQYNASSPQIFDKIKATLPDNWKITHVGSTAIGIAGKNIIDILIETKEIKQAQKWFGTKSWIKIIPKKNRRTILFKKKINSHKIIHAHITTPNSKDAKNLKFFISYLSKNKSARQKYITLKKEAIKLGKIDNSDYNKHKHEFIQNILLKQKKK